MTELLETKNIKPAFSIYDSKDTNNKELTDEDKKTLDKKTKELTLKFNNVIAIVN